MAGPPEYRNYFRSKISAAAPAEAWKEIFRHVLFYDKQLPYCIDWKGSYWDRIRRRYHDYLIAKFSSDPERECGRFYAHTGTKSQQSTGRAFEVAIERVLELGLKGPTCAPGIGLMRYPEFRHLPEFKKKSIPFNLRLIFSEVKPDLLLEARGSLQAVLSSKWTLRTDRAENARTEARNLKQLCNGRVPYIALVTNENDPQRLVSVARGYDLSRVYHCNVELLRHIYSTALGGYGTQGKLDQKRDAARSTLVTELLHAGRLRDLTDLFVDLNAL